MGSSEIVLKAMDRAINKTVMIAELIKRRIVGLHQNTSISSTNITDTWEPLEEGLLPLETTRHVSVITIILSKKELDTSSAGYQPPIPADQVKPSIEDDHEREGSPRMRGRGRGGQGRNGVVEYNGNGGWDGGSGRIHGRGRGGWGRGGGRGHRFRGRRRVYVGGNMQQESGDYNDSREAIPAGGRGRGRGRDRGRGRGWTQDSRSDGPVQAAT
ncbi:hypothetical protein SLA2020_068040 [Shorea laevis]